MYDNVRGDTRRESVPTVVKLHGKAVATPRLGNEGGSSRGLVLECWSDGTDLLVVSCETVNSRLDENQTELRVGILAVALEVLSDRDGLLDQVVKVLWDGWGKTFGLENSEDLCDVRVRE